jgi:threonine dehydrogenase-like Zn-dependent dehydrogenase/predicted NBD/HSP70 family sugar kinase
VSAGIVVDVGGTTTRVAAHRDGHLLGEPLRFATPSPRRDADRPLETIRQELFDGIAERATLLARAEPAAARTVGVAFGAVIARSGVVRDASVLWLDPSRGYDVGAALSARLPRARIRVVNDVEAAAWSFRALGRFALVTVSTGVAVKVFDSSYPPCLKVLLDADGLGGESGHTLVESSVLTGLPAGLGRAAADGDPRARAELERRALPWCECGAVGDLCSYTSGPAVARAAGARARRAPAAFAGSVLAELTGGDPDRIDTAALAEAARAHDGFTAGILRSATRHLAVRLVQICADLGLRRAVVIGGFAHGVGGPWFEALRANVSAAMVRTGWYAGWTDTDVARLIHEPAGAEDATLAGLAAWLAEDDDARDGGRGGTGVEDGGTILVAAKPVGEPRLELLRVARPRCGDQQLLLRPVFAGLCGTDLQILAGQRGLEPGVPGHECVAEVVETGSLVTGVAAGDVVTLNPNNPRDDDDKLGHNRPGVFAELMVLDIGMVRREQVVPLPRTAGAELVLVEPLAAVLRAQLLAAGTAPGEDVLVVGGGLAGLLHVALARHRGARTVLLATRSAALRERAVRLGLCRGEDVLVPGPRLGADVLAATGGAGADTAVIAVGPGSGVAATSPVWAGLAEGAAVHLFGGFTAGDVLPGARGELPVGPLRARAASETFTTPAHRTVTVMGSRGGLSTHMRAAVDLAAGHALALDRLISHVVSLPALPGAVEDILATRSLRGVPPLRVVVDLRLRGQVVRPLTPRAGGGVPRLHE